MEYRIYDQIVYFRVRSQYAAAVFSCEWQHVYSEDHELFMMNYLICARWFIFSMPRERPKQKENSAAINLAMRLLRYSCFIWFLIYNIILLLYWTYETTNSTSPVKDGELSSFHKLASIPCYVLYTGMC